MFDLAQQHTQQIEADVKNILTVLAYRRPSAPRSRPTTELAEA